MVGIGTLRNCEALPDSTTNLKKEEARKANSKNK